MPVFFQHQINDTTRLAIWKIEETEEYFKNNVPLHRDVTHPHKRLQHLAGRFLLQFLFADFPYELIQIADTHKPFLPDAQYQFSISHCADYAAVIVSRDNRVGIDIERPVDKLYRIRDRFLHPDEADALQVDDLEKLTTCWSVKEAVFKWYGEGGVDFKENIRLLQWNVETQTIDCFFTKTNQNLLAHYRVFQGLVLVWIEGSGG